MTLKHKRGTNDHGVSESIGFLLIFTIVIMGIGLVTLYGYPMLLQQQTSADEQIMEKNMIVLQNDIKSLAYKTVPYKETSLKIGGGSLTVYNSSYTPSSSTIKIYDSGTTYVDLFQPGELRYESVSAQTDISLQNGAVLLRRHFEPGSVMLAQPRWFYDGPTNTMVINLVNITSTDLMANVGIGTVQMALGEVHYTKTDIPIGAPSVYLDYTPYPTQDYSVAWDNYFQNTMGMTRDSGTPGTGVMVKYKLPTTTNPPAPATLVIKKYEVIIKSL